MCCLSMCSLHNAFAGRGYWPFDSRTVGGLKEATSVSPDMMLLSVSLWRELQGFDLDMSPVLESSDLCLRARQAGHVVVSTGLAAGVATQPLLSRANDRSSAYTSEKFNPLHLSLATKNALHAFSDRWMESQAEERRKHYITPAKLTWVIHCGGSQGMEAATILQHLYK